VPDQNINTGLRVYTAVAVAALPSAVTAGVGARAFVSDNDVNNKVGQCKTAAGGGTYACKVISNGLVWKVM
jgi:uncharacterized oligopeptide transporter (OPT) family protein